MKDFQTIVTNLLIAQDEENPDISAMKIQAYRHIPSGLITTDPEAFLEWMKP